MTSYVCFDRNFFSYVVDHDLLIEALKSGLDPNLVDKNGNALFMAVLEHCIFKFADIVKACIDGGADINCRDRTGRSALRVAFERLLIYGTSSKSLELLLRAGADPDGLRREPDDKRFLDSYRNNREGGGRNYFKISGKELKECGLAMDENSYTINFEDVISRNLQSDLEQAVLSGKLSPTRTDDRRVSFFRQALESGNQKLVDFLIENAPKLDLRRYNFESHKDARPNISREPKCDCCEWDTPILARFVSKGYTPLMMAALARSASDVKLLLEAGADPNVKDKNGLSALALAVSAYRYLVADHLMAYGADPVDFAASYLIMKDFDEAWENYEWPAEGDEGLPDKDEFFLTKMPEYYADMEARREEAKKRPKSPEPRYAIESELRKYGLSFSHEI